MLRRTVSKKSKIGQRLGYRRFVSLKQLFRLAIWVVIATVRMRPVLTTKERNWVLRLYEVNSPPVTLAELISLLQQGGVAITEDEAEEYFRSFQRVEGSIIPFCRVFQLFSREKRRFLRGRSSTGKEDNEMDADTSRNILSSFGLVETTLAEHLHEPLDWWKRSENGEWWKERKFWELSHPTGKSSELHNLAAAPKSPSIDALVRQESNKTEQIALDVSQSEYLEDADLNTDDTLPLVAIDAGTSRGATSTLPITGASSEVEAPKPRRKARMAKRVTTAIAMDSFLVRMEADLKERRVPAQCDSSLARKFYVPVTHPGQCFNDPPSPMHQSRQDRSLQDENHKDNREPFCVMTRIPVSELDRRPQRLVTSAGCRRPSSKPATVDSLHRKDFGSGSTRAVYSRPASATVRAEIPANITPSMRRWMLGGEIQQNRL